MTEEVIHDKIFISKSSRKKYYSEKFIAYSGSMSPMVTNKNMINLRDAGNKSHRSRQWNT